VKPNKAKPVQPAIDSESTSIVKLAKRLSTLVKRQYDLDAAVDRLPKRSAERNAAAARMITNYNEKQFLKRHIITQPAKNLGDAAAQLVLTCSLVTDLADLADGSDNTAAMDEASDMRLLLLTILHGVLRIVAKSARIDLIDIAATEYTIPSLIPEVRKQTDVEIAKLGFGPWTAKDRAKEKAEMAARHVAEFQQAPSGPPHVSLRLQDRRNDLAFRRATPGGSRGGGATPAICIPIAPAAKSAGAIHFLIMPGTWTIKRPE
jgi:hypothetical protein